MALNPDTKLTLVAIHKETCKEYKKIITFKEWNELKKNSNYYYKTYQF